MTPDYPDGTLPISIIGVTIATLPIDIKAQTLGTVGIDIAAQTLGQVDVNIAASAVTFNVAIQSSAVTLDVNIKASEATLNVDITAQTVDLTVDVVKAAYMRNIPQLVNPGFETGDFTGYHRIHDCTITDENYHSGEYSAKMAPVNTTAYYTQGLDVPIECKYIHDFNLYAMMYPGHGQGTCSIYVYYADGSADYHDFAVADDYSWHALNMTPYLDVLKILRFFQILNKSGNGVVMYTDDITLVAYSPIEKILTTVDINIKSSAVTLDINIASQAANVDVNIAAQEANVDVNIAASDITINVKTGIGEHVDTDIVSSVTLDVDVTAQSVGDISVDITAQSIGNIDINIKAQAVDLNIKTSGGANIVIDQLTQTAYTERRSTISNNGTAFSWTHPTGATRRGKFFPRGMRGFITTIDLYCRDAGSSGGTITVYLSPHPSMGYLYSADVTVPAEGSAAWRSATFNVMWNYDSLFLFILASSAEMETAFDADTPYDYYLSSDSGATWTTGAYRLHARVVMKGETIGDLPVSGTLNTIEIPHSGSVFDTGAVEVPSQATPETTVLTIPGAGYCESFMWECQHDEFDFYAYCDGVKAGRISPLLFQAYGFTASTPQHTLSVYAAGAACKGLENVRYEFRREFKITALQTTGAAVNCRIRATVNKSK